MFLSIIIFRCLTSKNNYSYGIFIYTIFIRKNLRNENEILFVLYILNIYNDLCIYRILYVYFFYKYTIRKENEMDV